MQRLRVAIYHNLHSGGAKRVTAEHLQRLAQHHDLSLFALDSADLQFGADLTALHIPISIRHFRPRPWLRSPFGRLNTLIGMANVARLDRIAQRTAHEIDLAGFDVVLAHPCQFSQAPLLLRWLKTPSLYYCHELPRMLYEPEIARPYHTRRARQNLLDQIDPLPGICRAYYRLMDRAAALRATSIAVNSRYTAANVSNAYHRDAIVCYQGVNSRNFVPATEPRQRFVLSVGALTPAKGFEHIIRALATMPSAERPPLVLVCNFQNSEERAFLEQLAQECSVDLQVHVGISDAELQRWYTLAGCLVYAPIREPFGLVALEAMSAGVPLVAVQEGGVAETVIAGLTGLVAPREPVALGRAISTLLEDGELAVRLGQAARQQCIRQWTWERHIEQLEALLQQTAQAAAVSSPLEIA